jgi:hypothetical protein
MEEDFRNLKDQDNVSPDIFDKAQQYVMTQMEKYHFPRFLKSIVYLTMYNQLTSGGDGFELPAAVSFSDS